MPSLISIYAIQAANIHGRPSSTYGRVLWLTKDVWPILFPACSKRVTRAPIDYNLTVSHPSARFCRSNFPSGSGSQIDIDGDAHESRDYVLINVFVHREHAEIKFGHTSLVSQAPRP